MRDTLTRGMHREPAGEPIVEEVERPDGRYILYVSWPAREADGRATWAAEADRAGAPDQSSA